MNKLNIFRRLHSKCIIHVKLMSVPPQKKSRSSVLLPSENHRMA